MRPRLFVSLTLLVVGPLMVLGIFAVRAFRSEHVMRQQQLQEILQARLEDYRATVARLLDQRRQQLEKLTSVPALTPATIRERIDRVPFVDHFFVQDARGELVYPALAKPLTEQQKAFLRRTTPLWTRQDRVSGPAIEQRPDPENSGWYTWFWEKGLHLIYWRRDARGHIVGVELGRARLLADVVATLPAPSPTRRQPIDGQIVLSDARGNPVYQWGDYQPPPAEAPRAQLPLADPLSAWHLSYHMSPQRFAAAQGPSTLFAVITSLVVLALVLSTLAFYLYRESTREIRDAEQRVSFVNQVSHELRTPLTNIRMYAEMLAGEIDDAAPRAARHLDVIVSESQRLSRLIGNVLAFARQQRGGLKVRRSVGVLDEIVRDVLTQFSPSLSQKKMTVHLEPHANRQVSIDADVVAQVVANLISNVEKYAAGGGYLEIVTSQDLPWSTVRVSDRGPGIPTALVEKVFRPFFRIKNEVTEGVTGTGIGLALARDLARLHGGDLIVVPTPPQGSCLELTLHTPEGNPNESPRG